MEPQIPQNLAEIQYLIAQRPETRIAVGFYNLESGDEWFIAPDEVFHAASTMKVGVMMEAYTEAALVIEPHRTAGLCTYKDQFPA